VADATGFGVLALGFLFIDDRRETGQLVEVRDDSGQHPKHAWTVERDVFRLGIGLGWMQNIKSGFAPGRVGHYAWAFPTTP
jgi:hypothetical protein